MVFSSIYGVRLKPPNPIFFKGENVRTNAGGIEMKESKTTKIDIRLTTQEKERLKQFAAERKTTISELVRQALN